MFIRGVAESKIIDFLIKKLEAGNLQYKLTIIDAYFFSSSKRFGDTQRRISNILEPFKENVRFLEIITSTQHFNKAKYERLSKHLDYLVIEIIKKDDFHDRFWIVDERQAFFVGTSINSFGTNTFFYKMIFYTNMRLKP